MRTGIVAGIAIVLGSVVSPQRAYAQAEDIVTAAKAAYDSKEYAIGAPLCLIAATYEPAEAIAHLVRAARCYALSDQKDLAYFTLDAAVHRGWRDWSATDSSQDFDAIRMDDRWKRYPARITRANKDSMIHEFNLITVYSYQYKIRPASMGGGHGSYAGLKLPQRLLRTGEATYEVLEAGDAHVVLKGTSRWLNAGIQAKIDIDGRLGEWLFVGAFQ